jgi:ferredoxin/flavodoxin---NADP+ reductase
LPDCKIGADILIKSIGYASTPMPGAPFNERTKTIPHEFGCVVDPATKETLPGLYVCGWAKRGPVGIIDATLRDTKETFGVLRHHIETEQLVPSELSVDEIS